MRTATITRQTSETNITLSLNLDGGKAEISTGIGFFDHMLNSLAVHSGFGLSVMAKGDLNVDGHHTVEDVGIVLGQAMAKALGDKKGIKRFASAMAPMDECLALAVVDVSGRPFFVFDAPDLSLAKVGEFDASLTEEFFRALAFNAGITLHMKVAYGTNAHHMIEALFKALALTLKDAVRIIGDNIPSSKGVL